jgi:hypothetical protein
MGHGGYGGTAWPPRSGIQQVAETLLRREETASKSNPIIVVEVDNPRQIGDDGAGGRELAMKWSVCDEKESEGGGAVEAYLIYVLSLQRRRRRDT